MYIPSEAEFHQGHGSVARLLSFKPLVQAATLVKNLSKLEQFHGWWGESDQRSVATCSSQHRNVKRTGKQFLVEAIESFLREV